MNEQASQPPSEGNSRNKRDKVTFLAIMAVFILPFFVLPVIMAPETRSKTNKGTFVQPHVAIQDLPLQSLESGSFDLPSVEGKWTLVYVLPPRCEQACLNSLYSIRQVRKSLDRDVNRVRQLVVHTQAVSSELEGLLSTEFSEILQAKVDASELNALFSEPLSGQPASRAGNIYLMSPDGYIFMYYPSYEDEQESILRARDIRKDLKKSMKGSLIG